jgi:adenosylmethionine-8-amino-7-oxononanoate aminotransferase
MKPAPYEEWTMQPELRNRLLRNTFVDFQQMSAFVEDPLIYSRAEGLYCWDIHGKRYFDAIGGVFVAVLGHRPPAVLEAIRRQMDEITFGAPLHGISETTLRLNEKLGSVTPGDLNYIKSFSGGSESVEAALKFARQYFKQTGCPGKYKVISLYLSYHGATFAAMAATGYGKRKVKFEPQMPGFVKVFSPIQLRDWFPSWEEANRFAANMVEQTIVNENPETVSAVLIEPICNTAGIVAPTAEYLQMVRDACTRHNVLLIFDEVLTGFGRTGDMFAAQTFDVTPDILCSGKGLSGGVIPIGAMIARESLGEAFFGPVEADIQFAHGHTFAGNPLAAAAGIAVIDELTSKGLPAKARSLGARLRTRLEGLKRLGVVREVRGKGLLLGVELVEDAAANRPYPEGRKLGDALKKTALRNGLIMRIDPDWFAVSPPLIASEADLDELGDLIDKSLREAMDLAAQPAGC